ncbi:hypothetical protein CLG96_16065 [Sphingomonas oleivorans]|uniref:Phytanoyl-CoA dioxygenase n=1 Tax=Sphingomonas oleivorans TaxID=1735121 RepID=A0A2T5FUM8_9SPHN|nr:hypothetical protein [Sphingomonas oleivorans]PTQ08216.1 hypothetical protein CLG96_16065 [Sphingomonas oleivorans]
MRKLARLVSAKAPTYLHFAKAEPSWVAMFVLARFSLVRRLAWARPRNWSMPRGSTIFEEADAGEIAASLRRDGLYRPLKLPAEIVAEIMAFAQRMPCFADKDRSAEFLPRDIGQAQARRGKAIVTGHYLDRTEQCPALVRVANDALLMDVARAYLGGDPKLIRLRLWWSFPAPAASEGQRRLAAQDHYHYDLGDWREIKVFFYLTPVDAKAGPHVYIKRSHRAHSLADQLSPFLGRPRREVLRRYGPENVVVLHGDAGEGFVEDPYGFHMATSVTGSPRLMLEISFGPSTPSRRRYYDERIGGN